MIVSLMGHLEISKLLFDYGAQVDLQQKGGGSALMMARHFEVAQLLLNNGAQVDMQDDGGRCALFVASHFGHDQVVGLLANMEVTVKGKTPLSMALEKAHAPTVKLLNSKVSMDVFLG